MYKANWFVRFHYDYDGMVGDGIESCETKAGAMAMYKAMRPTATMPAVEIINAKMEVVKSKAYKEA